MIIAIPFFFVILFFLSWPFFVDLNGFYFVASKGPFSADPDIPFPVGALGLCLFIFVVYFMFLFKRGKLCIGSRNSILLFCLLMFFSFYCLIVPQVSVVRLVQLVIPICVMMVMVVPDSPFLKKCFFYSIFYGASIWMFFHLVSIFLGAGTLSISKYDFVVFYGYDIYQALVSYPGVLFLFFLLSYVVYTRPGLGNKFIGFFSMFMSLLLMALAARRASFVDVFLFLLIVYCVPLFGVLLGRKFLFFNAVLKILLVNSFLAVVFFAGLKLPIFDRFVGSFSSGNADAGRLDKYVKAVEYFGSDFTRFLFGGGQGVPGFHNFFLDAAYRIGLVGVLLLLIMLVLSSYWFLWKANGRGGSGTSYQIIKVLVLSLLFQSMINTPLTQPYYALNFLMVAYAVRYLQPSKA